MAMIDCPECGKQVSDKAPACPTCGMPIARQPPVLMPPQLDYHQLMPQMQPQHVQPLPSRGLTCRKCGSKNVNVQMLQTAASTSTKGKGCLFTIVRWTLIICTCGLWLLFGKKKSKSKTTFSNQKVAVCSNCGNSWNI